MSVVLCAESFSVSADTGGCGDSEGELCGSDGGSADGVGAVDVGGSSVLGSPLVADSVSSVPVWAPPLLPTVTPGATSLDDEVVPAADVAVSVVCVESSETSEPEPVDGGGVDADESVEVLVVSAAVDFSEALASPADVDDASDVSADASPGDATIAAPIPNAAANAPTRPM